MPEDKFAVRTTGWHRKSSYEKGYRPCRVAPPFFLDIKKLDKPKRRLLLKKRKEFARLMYKEISCYMREDSKLEKIEQEISEFKQPLDEDQRAFFDEARKYGLVRMLEEPKRARREYIGVIALNPVNIELLDELNIRISRYRVLLEECRDYPKVCRKALEYNNEPKTAIENFLGKIADLDELAKKLYLDINKKLNRK